MDQRIYKGIILKQYKGFKMVTFISFCELDLFGELDHILRDPAWSGYDKDPCSKIPYNIWITSYFTGS